MQELPGRIQSALSALPADQLSRESTLADSTVVHTLLTSEVEKFDASLGDAVKALCPDPASLTEEEGKAIAEKHRDIIQRAQHGTTVAIALVSPAAQLLWSVGLGDSTVREYPSYSYGMYVHELVNSSSGLQRRGR